MPTRRPFRRAKAARSPTRRHWRSLNRSPVRRLPGYEPGPDYVAQALVAFRRAIRAHRRLARLAPHIFDSAVVEQERRDREAQRRWMESWEPAFEKIYGPSSAAEREAERQAEAMAQRPPKLHPRTERAMERELARWELWFGAAQLALRRHRQCRPHALIPLHQIASLLDIAATLGRLACGLDPSLNALRDTPCDQTTQFAADLKRAYGNGR